MEEFTIDETLLERCKTGDSAAMLEMSKNTKQILSNLWLVRAVLYGNNEAREILRKNPERAKKALFPIQNYIPGEREVWFTQYYSGQVLKIVGLDEIPDIDGLYRVAGLSKERVFVIGVKTGYEPADEDGFGAETYYDYYVYDEFFRRISKEKFVDDYRAAYAIGADYIKTHNNLPSLRIDWLLEDGILDREQLITIKDILKLLNENKK